ncbi:hypothetical protein [Enterococcus sp. CSURQ0835]|uniref:hypothetical protein n=1 Tax=Enterococcus sp. CSURQ0835 TaxID=2681394 RepID=UPI00135ADAEA|nr:hypothetical protein [Enterococcus sp. CSURQ0835]
MKKISLLMALAGLFLFSACGNSNDESSSTASTETKQSNTINSSQSTSSSVVESTESTVISSSSTLEQTSQSETITSMTASEASTPASTPVEATQQSTADSQTSETESVAPVQDTVETTTNVEPTAAETPAVVVSSEDQALAAIHAAQPETANDDIVLRFYQMIGSDYLFDAESKQLAQHGGTGSVGFYRVSTDGSVRVTNAYGN